MHNQTDLNDIIGIESVKLGFFKEVQKTIDELKASNLELAERQRDVQAILDGIPDVVAVVSQDYEMLSVNKAFFETYKVKEPIGKFCYSVFKENDTPCSPCPLLTAKEGSGRVFRQLHIMDFKGEKRQIECSASMMRSTNGTPGRTLLLHRDVTLEKKYQAKYFQAERMATIGVLAEGVAHEINNPLTSIRGFAEALFRRLEKLYDCSSGEEHCSDLLDDFREYLDIVLKECNRCSDIVQNLLSFGRRDVRSLSLVNLADIVSNSLKLLQPRLAPLPDDIITVNQSTVAPYVLGHPGELMQVALNIILNALYAVQDSGEITIETEVSGSMAIIRVSDTGCGISEKHIDKLFEPFFTTKPAGQGIGVGLSTCYNIIQKHGGGIFVESQEGENAVFEIILPYIKE